MDPTVIAVIGTVCGGVGLKFVEHVLGRSKVRMDEAAKIREELRDQIDDLKVKVNELEVARDKWREDYYALRDKYVELQTQLTIAQEKIKELLNRLGQAVEEVDKRPPNPV